MSDPFFWTIALSVAFLTGLAKSGLLASLGMMSVPLLALVMAPREAAGVLLPVLLVMDGFAIYNFRKEFDWQNLKILLPGSVTGIGLGWALSSFVSDAAVTLAIGVIALVFVADALLPLRKKLLENMRVSAKNGNAASLPLSRGWGTLWGGVAGFTSFISHAGGPPFQVYVLPQKLTPTIYAGTTAWFFAVTNGVKLIPYFFLGQLSLTNLKLSAALVPVAIAGILIGIFLVRRISTDLFYRIAYGLVFLVSLKLIHDGLAGIGL